MCWNVLFNSLTCAEVLQEVRVHSSDCISVFYVCSVRFPFLHKEESCCAEKAGCPLNKPHWSGRLFGEESWVSLTWQGLAVPQSVGHTGQRGVPGLYSPSGTVYLTFRRVVQWICSPVHASSFLKQWGKKYTFLSRFWSGHSWMLMDTLAVHLVNKPFPFSLPPTPSHSACVRPASNHVTYT